MKSLSKEGSSLIRAFSGLPRPGRGDKTRSGGLLSLLGKGKEAAASEPTPDALVRKERTGMKGKDRKEKERKVSDARHFNHAVRHD